MKRVFISGHFNVLHPGHLRLFRFAKECGDYLIVGVESDRIAKESAYVKQDLRLDGVSNNSLVDEVILIDEPISNTLEKIKPDIVVKGKEHEALLNPEDAIVKAWGGRLVFTSGETIFSSYDLIRQEFQEFNKSSISLPIDYMNRHRITANRLIELIESFRKLKIVIIGDLIIDEYITCEPLGMSQEDPTIVVTPIDSKKFIGGAAIVAAHAVGLGAQAKYFSVSGNDDARQYVLNELEAVGVESSIFVDLDRPTTLKQRYRSKGKSLLRVSHLHQMPISMKIQDEIFSAVVHQSDKINIGVFSDFNYGCLPQPLVNRLIEYWKLHNVMMVADSQTSSQVGDVCRFRDMDFITPTEHEARVSTQNKEDGLVVLAEKLMSKSNARNIFLKLGEDGLLIQANKKESSWLTDRISALNTAPKDVAGAGDSLLIASAMTRAVGGNIWEAGLIGSIAAALQVGRLGNTPLSAKELINEIKR